MAEMEGRRDFEAFERHPSHPTQYKAPLKQIN